MIKNWLKKKWYSLKYRHHHLKIGSKVIFDKNCYFEGWNVIGNNVKLSTTKLGLGTYISPDAVIRYTHIGRFCSIGSNLQTGLGLHPANDFVSTHPAFFSTRKQAGFSFTNIDLFQENKFVNQSERCIVKIGNDVWIGNNVTIMDGITIGDGAIIATGAIVTHDVESYSIVAGIPAKFKRYRFSEEEIEKLNQIKWWNWDLAKLKEKAPDFSNIREFNNRYFA